MDEPSVYALGPPFLKESLDGASTVPIRLTPMLMLSSNGHLCHRPLYDVLLDAPPVEFFEKLITLIYVLTAVGLQLVA